MPLVAFLREGASSREVGWHRNAERRARGLFPMSNLSVQLEPWERQLALVEILLLSGGTPYANFRDLAHAWGRDKGFHQIIVNNVCERRGEVERKRRCDAGKPMSDERRENFRTKYKRARTGGDDEEQQQQHGGGGDATIINNGGAVVEGTTITSSTIVPGSMPPPANVIHTAEI
mmetsp:Transcript_12852/g.35241  ORF Transcript_12852/g.35241 Transcript_12852/m.35241 type:complete len:175 (+) Transcript_12852:467-991(+)